MRVRPSRSLALVATLLALALPGSPAARASHGTDDAAWIAQAGDGRGESSPVLPDFLMRTVLFDGDRFPLRSGAPRPGAARYLAWGTVLATLPDGTTTGRLALSTSDDGLTWSSPAPAVLKDDAGVDLPFLLNDVETASVVPAFLDVVYQGREHDRGAFVIWYRVRDGDPLAAFSDCLGPPCVPEASIHTAVSDDGVTWFHDRPAAQVAPGSMTTGTTGFNAASFGPTDVVYQPSGSISCHTGTPAPTFPWNCRYVMLYDTSADGDAPEGLALGGSGDAITWRGTGAPALSPGAGWDAAVASIGSLRRTGAGWTLAYAGSDGAPCGALACFGTGIATSASATPSSFTRASSDPATPRGLFDHLGGTTNASLVFARIVEDACPAIGCHGDTHARIYTTRVSGTGLTAARDVFLASTSPAPEQAPSIRISRPSGPYRNTAATPIDVYMTDTLGANAGVNLHTLRIAIDGEEIDGGHIFSDTLVTALTHPAIRVSVPGFLNSLPDGAHTVSVAVTDHDGKVARAEASFVLDSRPPQTRLESHPASPVLTLPGGSLGTFSGQSDEERTALLRVEALVTNPLGQQKTYPVPAAQVGKLSAQVWRWTWLAPTADGHFALPGTYTVTLRAVDVAGNVERASTANTVTVVAL